MSRAGVRRRAVRAAVASVAVVAVLPLWAGDAGAETQIEDLEDIAPPPASEDPTPPDEGLLPDVLEPGTEPPSASDPARRYHSLGSQLSTLAVAADYGAGDGLPDTDMTEGAKPPTLPGGTNSTVSLSEPMLLTIQLDGNQDGVLAFLAEHGITPANVGSDYLEAAVPPTLLAQLARQTGVARVRELPTPQRLLGTTTSEGLAVHEASRWHFAGHKGQGVKIGVIDAVSPRLPDGTRGWGKDGFTGLLARMGNELKDGYTGLLARTGNELPLTVKGMCFPGPGVATFDLRDCDARHGSDHGTQVAETVMDIAPEASLYISNASTFADLQRAVEWMHAQGVKVIVYSIGWTFHGAADGSSPITPSPLNTVKWATDRGIVWVNSAGNGAQRNWYGPFTDTDDDGYHEWWQEGGSVDEGLRYSWTGIGRSEVTVFMRWDDTWGGAAKDLDLQLIHRADANAPWRVVAASADTQNGGSADYPYEAITRFEGVGAGEYEIVVKKRAGSAAPAWLQLRIFGRHTLSEHRVAASSIATPADSPSSGLLAAGSADVKDIRSVSSYSARGPTPDGRTKPDLVAGTCSDISGKQYPFCGTSAAAPHLAGLAALVRQRFPTLTATQVAAYLKSNAAERGETGPDNEWGHGFAQLPSTGLPAVDRDVDCVTDLAGNGTVQGHWTGVCESSGDTDVFGRFYQFSLAERRQVTIDLDSSRHLSALYLRSGLGQLSGEPLHSDTGSWIDVNFEPDSQISQSLPAGDYTIEATTIKTLTTDGDTRLGAFTLTVAGLATDAPTAGPEVSIAAGAAITEGASASFTISADPAPTAPLAVSLVVNDLGAFAASGAAGPQTVTIPTSGSVTHSVATVDDKVGEADGVITATLVAGGSYTVSETQGAATVAVADNEPVVSIAGDADPITEGETATFTVSVTPAPSAPLRLGVTLKITQRGDYAAPGETGTWVITVPTTGSAQLTIATVDDVVGERTGGITATILRAPGLNMFAAQRIAEVIVWDNEPVITVTRDLDVTEGEDAVFSVWARPPPSVPLSVTLTITQQGDYAEPGATGTRTVTIPTAGSGRLSSSAQFTVATVDDDAVEADGAITATLQPSQRYRTPRTISRTTSGMEATVAVADNDGLRADPPADPSCMHDLAGPGKVSGEWTGACLTATGTSGKSAEYYSFRLDQESRVTIDLRGEQGGSRDTYLYLRKGRGERSAALVAQNDDGRPRSGAYPLSALLEVTLAAGDYTIEATTYGSRVRGPFTLEVTGIPPQTPRTQRTPTTPQTPEVSVSGTAGVTEGADAVFTVTAAPAPSTPLTVSLAVTQQGDYAGAGATGTKTVTVPTSGSVTHTVATVDDSTDEADGGITATLSAGQGYTVSSSGGVHTVSVSDDDVPEISVTAGADIDEGGSASFTITADPAPHTSLTVSLTVTQQGDYAAAGATGTKTVTVATSGSVTHTVATTDDSADEADGSVTVTLKAGSGYTVSSAQRVATVGVSDDDAPPATTPEVSVTAGAGITEGGNAGFTITASPAPASPLSVSVTVTQTGDFAASGTTGGQTVTVPVSGSVSHTVATTDDSTDEADGSVTVTLKAGSGYTVSSSRGAVSVAVADDDAPPPVPACVTADAALLAQVLAKTQDPWNGARPDLLDTFTRAHNTMLGTDTYTVADLKARPDRHESNWQGDGPNALWQKVYAELDRLQACREKPQTPPPPPPPPTPEVSVTAGAGVTEGAAASFTFTAAPAPASPLTVTITVTQTGDYGAPTGTKTVTVPTGGAKTYSVATAGDSTDEADGSVTVTVKAGSGYTVSSSQGAATVAVADDDDPTPPPPPLPPPPPPPPDPDPEVRVTAGGGVTEGQNASFTVTAAPAPSAPLAVSVTVTQSGDYGASTGTRTVTVPTGGAKSFSVATAGDSADEADGSVTVTVNAGSGYTVSSSHGAATVGVADDDATAVTLAASAGGAIAEDGGAREITLTLGRALAAGESLTAPLSVTGAAAGSHYTLALKQGQGVNEHVTLLTGAPHSAQDPAVALAAGARVATLLLTALPDDDTDERTVRVAFGAERRAPTGQGLSGGVAAAGGPLDVAVTNDDAPPPRNLPTIAIDDVRDVEESWVLSFRVTLSEASTERVTVDYATVEGTAYGSVDFGDVRARTLVLPPGTTRATIHIAVRDDTRRERDETFQVVLSNPAGATIARGTATGTIINDD